MSFGRLNFLILSFVFVYVCAGVVAVKVSAGEWFPDEFNAALSIVEGCTSEKNSVVCSRPAVKKLLDLKSGAEVMDALSPLLEPMECHYIGHVVGQQSYAKYRDVETAISQCNRACDSACVHGVVGQAFAEELGIEDSSAEIDLKHLSPDDVRRIGRKLCKNIGLCHGVGHALFQTYQEFKPAFAMCREIADDMLRQCYNGITMEYADALSSRSVKSASSVEYPEHESLSSFCIFPSQEETRACFRYFPRVVAITLQQRGFSREQSLKFTRDICESYELPKTRYLCFTGIGSYGSYLVYTDTDAAVESCEWLSDKQAIIACILGKISVATEDRKEKLALYCGRMVDDELRLVCYQGLFYSLDKVGVLKGGGGELCRDGDDVCKEGLKNKGIDPAARIFDVID